ncbi:MAG: DUF3592 domain-containing protein [Betaproteobacteria bacterium]|nr:DUF3592 domain-containing protein [Betaproteobacteria bacterium]
MPKPYSDPVRKAWPIFLLFVLSGLGFMTPFVLQAIRDVRIAKIYRLTECRIVGERLVTSTSSSVLGGRWVESRYSHTEFTWSYKVDGGDYTAEGYDNHEGVMADPQEMGNIAPGIKHECWYDPAAPEKSVLVRHFRAKFYFGALIPGLFILLGGSFLRGALRRAPQEVETGAVQGERLRFRLAPVLSAKGLWGCLTVLIAAMAAFIVLGLPSIGGDLTLYLICIGIEGFLIYHLVRAIPAARIASPIVEIDDEPLRPGMHTRLFIRHPGPAPLASLQANIVCEKVGQGGTRSAYNHMVFKRENLNIAGAEEFEATFSIPAKASPSAKTVQTATAWYVRVSRKLGADKSHETDYTFRVAGDSEKDRLEPEAPEGG